MEKLIVEIVYTDRELEEIKVTGQEMPCAAIRGRPIPSWFEKIDGRISWAGLVEEIRNFVYKKEIEPEFKFEGNAEDEAIFRNCLEKNGLNRNEPTTADLASMKYENAMRAEHRNQAEEESRFLTEAAQLGHSSALRKKVIPLLDAEDEEEKKQGVRILQDASRNPADFPADFKTLLGHCYAEGIGVSKNHAEAAKWFSKASEDGDPEGLYRYADCLMKGYGVEKDPQSALEKLQEAASKSYIPALLRLGLLYHTGDTSVGTRNDEIALNWFRQAAALGDPSAKRYLGEFYLNGWVVEADRAEAQRLLEEAAPLAPIQEKGEAEYLLGQLCKIKADEAAEETEREALLSQMVYYYQQAWEHGEKNVARRLWWSFLTGSGTEMDYDMAAEWFSKSTDIENPDINAAEECDCGIRLLYGEGIPESKAEAFHCFLCAAQQGDAKGQYYAGLCCANGWGTVQSYEKAADWFKKAAEQGNNEARVKLGQCYEMGTGMEKNCAEAVRWYRAAAEDGFPAAQRQLGKCLFSGIGTDKDVTEALRQYRVAADQDDAEAKFLLGNCLLNGFGVQRDEEEALKWLRAGAAQKNADAECMLGACYLNGCGVDPNEEIASGWFQKAADHGSMDAKVHLGKWLFKTNKTSEAMKLFLEPAETGDVRAQLGLGRCYYSLRGMPDKAPQAFAWLNRAAEQEEPEALRLLGDCYSNGIGVAPDSFQARLCFHKVAKLDDSDAEYNLACSFEMENSLKPSRETAEKAFEYFHKAALKGNPDAEFRLGRCYMEGIGVKADEREAVKWYSRGAEQGNVDAQYELGKCFLLGRGYLKNDVAAKGILEKAAEQGSAEAHFQLGMMVFTKQNVSAKKGYSLGLFLKSKEGKEMLRHFEIAGNAGIKKAKSILSNLRILNAQNDTSGR